MQNPAKIPAPHERCCALSCMHANSHQTSRGGGVRCSLLNTKKCIGQGLALLTMTHLWQRRERLQQLCCAPCCGQLCGQGGSVPSRCAAGADSVPSRHCSRRILRKLRRQRCRLLGLRRRCCACIGNVAVMSRQCAWEEAPRRKGTTSSRKGQAGRVLQGRPTGVHLRAARQLLVWGWVWGCMRVMMAND